MILHHYPRSPFAEKVRLAFGIKGLSWQSVEQPRLAPKPLLTALTGGYRRIPVLQIGADIYCDSRCILDEIERRHPAPGLRPPGSAGLAEMIAGFCDRFLFASALGLVFALHGERFPPELHADRARFTAGQFDGWDSQAMRRKLASTRYHLAQYCGWLDSLLGDGRSFLVGGAVSVADLAAFHPLWYAQQNLDRSDFDPGGWPGLAGWFERMGAFGHGVPSDLPADQALAIARAAEPAAVACATLPAAGAPRLGSSVAVAPDDWGFDPVEGELVGVSADRISLRRYDPAVGFVVVHFPHVGFVLRGCASASG